MPTITSQGRGKPAYRLMIEGWPEMFVSDTRITASAILDGRTVVPGLSYSGLQIQERLFLQEGRTEPNGMTFRIVPAYGLKVSDGSFTDPVTTSLSQYPDPVAQLEVTIDDNDTSLTLVGGATLTDGRYHIGTEVIEVDTFPTVIRTRWDTQAQSHRASVRDESRAIFIFERPPTMEGRRCFLYRYEPFDPDEDLTDTGEAIWRGVVSRQPRLDHDGITWLIDALPITHVLKQTVSAAPSETRVVGLYHHHTAAFGIRMWYDNDGDGDGTWGDVYRVMGVHTEEGLVTAVNAQLATALTAVGADASIDYIELERSGDEGWRLHMRTGTVTGGFRIVCGSVICGFVTTGFVGLDPWDLVNGDVGTFGDDFDLPLPSDADGYIPLTFNGRYFIRPDVGTIYNYASHAGEGHVSPLGAASQLVVTRNFAGSGPFRQLFQSSDPTDVANYPERRIHINDDYSTVEQVYIPGTGDDDGFYAVESSGNATISTGGSTSNIFRIDIEPMRRAHPRPGLDRFAGFLIADTVIQPTVQYSADGSILGFKSSLVTESVNANDGDTPWITDADMATWELAEENILVPEMLHRSYHFARELAAEAILGPELVFIGYCMRLESDGRIGIVGLPNFTEAQVVAESHQITGADIVTPAHNYGAWPTVEPQRDGVITTILVQQEYDPIADEWTDVPTVLRDPAAIATNKTRGKQQLQIKLYSRFINGAVDPANLAILVGRTLNLLSRDYIVIEIPVTWKKSSILCGDVVSLTYLKLPNGTGGRGFTERRAMVIGKRWPLDPKESAHGWLTLWMPARPIYGYAPAGIITAQSNVSGNTWNLTLNVANTTNIELSTNNDGEVLDHFADGYYISIIQYDDDTPTIMYGQISGEPNAAAGTCQVTLDDTWTPGGSTWGLHFQIPDEGLQIQDAQRVFAYVADEEQRLTDNSFARFFA